MRLAVCCAAALATLEVLIEKPSIISSDDLAFFVSNDEVVSMSLVIRALMRFHLHQIQRNSYSFQPIMSLVVDLTFAYFLTKL